VVSAARPLPMMRMSWLCMVSANNSRSRSGRGEIAAAKVNFLRDSRSDRSHEAVTYTL